MTLTQQLIDRLSELIEKQEFQQEDHFPNELELCDQYRVSRHTVREAIRELVMDGSLYRVQGKGPFVNDMKLSVDAGKKINFTSFAESSGYHPATSYFSIEKLDSHLVREAAIALGVVEGTIWCVDMIRSVNKITLVYTTAYLPFDKYPCLDGMVNEYHHMDLYALLQVYFKVGEIAKGPYTMEVIMPEPREMKLLKIPGTIPCILMKSVSRQLSGEVIDYRISISRSDMIRFTNLIFEYDNESHELNDFPGE
jgi:GntR family transcriptional regulator